MSRLRLTLVTSTIVVLLLALAASVIFLWGAYYQHWEGSFPTGVAKALPIPAARIGKRTVLLRDYYGGVVSVQKYLTSEEAAAQNQRRPLTVDDRSATLERLIQEAALYELADARGVKVTDEQEQAVLSELNVTSTSTADFQKFISENYGWSLDDFKMHIVRPLVLTRTLATSYAADHGGDPKALQTYLEDRIKKPDVIRYVKF
jgi:parvulin-like peptidyl-prolyl isomerase